MLRSTALLIASALVLIAQNEVPKEFQHERIVAIVPMIGDGTAQNPFRPMFVPAGNDPASEAVRFLSVSYEVSDDGKTAVVEFVAESRVALAEIIDASRGRDVQIFQPGRDSKEDLEREVQKFKPDYSFDASKGRKQ